MATQPDPQSIKRELRRIRWRQYRFTARAKIWRLHSLWVKCKIRTLKAMWGLG